MPGDPYKKVATGDPFDPAAIWYNGTQDVLRAYRRGGSPATISNPGAGVQGKFVEGLRYVQNNSGKDVAQYGVLTIDEVIFTPTDNLQEFKNNAALTGIDPDSVNFSEGHFVIAYDPIPDGKVGRAFVFGVCPVQIDFAADTDEWADVKDGDVTKLKSDDSSGGAYVLWKESGIGTKWALVRLCNVPASAVTWLRINAPEAAYSAGPPPVGGGGWYEADVLAGKPTDPPDPITDVAIPVAGETIPPLVFPYNGLALAQNSLEANLGDPPSHWVQTPCYVPAWLISSASTDADGKRPTYRFAYPRPGPTTLSITGIYGSLGSIGGPGIGGWRYQASFYVGTPQKVTIAGATTLPDNGEIVNVGSLTPVIVCFENAPESGNVGSFRLPAGTQVTGVFTGGYSDDVSPVPIYRGSVPMPDVFEVVAADDGSGTNAADATSYATYKYNFIDLVTGNIYVKGADPGTNRPAGFLVGPASTALVQFLGGTATLVQAFEYPAVATCPDTASVAAPVVMPSWIL